MLYYPYQIENSCFGGLDPIDLRAEESYNVTFNPEVFFQGDELDEERKCYTKVHFDYNLRKDQVVRVVFSSWNATRYWDIRYHVGPCWSEANSNPIKLNYTYKLDP